MIKIAVAEDDLQYANQLKQYMAQFEKDFGQKLDVTYYVDGADLVKDYQNQYEVLLLDIEMPKMDGYEATLKIRKLPNRIRANTPIIAFTANAVSENRDRAFAVGMDDFLVKPVNTSRLLSCLAKLL